MSLELNTLAADTTTLRQKGGWCEVDLACIRISGQDARRYLQAQTTNDLNTLDKGGSQGSCLIDRKSRPVGCYRLFNRGDEYAIICDTRQAKDIFEHLEKYKFADVVDFEQSGPIKFLTIQGRGSRAVLSKVLEGPPQRDLFEKDIATGLIAGSNVEILRYSLTGEEGFLIKTTESNFDSVGSALSDVAQSLGMNRLTEPILECARIEAGIPRLGDDFSKDNLLAETTLDETSVSYNKGCFQGQEVLARIRGQGSPTRSVVGLTIEPPPPTPWEKDTEIQFEGETVGTIKSNCYSEFLKKYVAMAIVKRDYRTPGKKRPMTIGGKPVTVTVEILPFYKAEPPEAIARKLYEEALSVFAREDESETSSKDWQSIELLKEAVLLDPLFEDAYESLGVILNRRGETDEAIEVMEHLAHINPDSVMAHTNLSVFYVEKGWKEKAEEEKAISMSIRMRMAAAQVSKDKELDEQRKALQAETLQRMSMFQQVLEIDADDQLANYGYGDCLTALERFEEAVPYLEKAIALKPSHSVAYVSLGKAFEGSGRKDDARKTYLAGIDAAARRGDGEPMKKMQDRLNQL
jgi:folate-binding protein YgfZ